MWYRGADTRLRDGGYVLDIPLNGHFAFETHPPSCLTFTAQLDHMHDYAHALAFKRDTELGTTRAMSLIVLSSLAMTAAWSLARKLYSDDFT